MRAPVSIVIPTLNAAETLPSCLAALMEGNEGGVIRELIISDGGSEDDTKVIANEVGANLVTGAASRGGQLRRGADTAAGQWLLFLHADTELSPGWSDAVLDHIANSRRKAAWFRLKFDEGGFAARIVASWANIRARFLGLPFGDQGLLISRSLYDAVGGFEDIPLMEDVTIVRRLGRKRLTQLRVTAQTSAQKYARKGWFRRGRANLWLQICFFLGASPERLERRYRQ